MEYNNGICGTKYQNIHEKSVQKETYAEDEEYLNEMLILKDENTSMLEPSLTIS